MTRIRLEPRPPWLDEAAQLQIPCAAGGSEEVDASEADLEFVMREHYRPRPRMPLHAALPFHYHRIPAGLRLRVAKALLGRPHARVFPRQPFEPSVDAIRLSREAPPVWPAGKRFALLLTHDVDTARGLALVPELASLERGLGVRSAFFVCSHHYRLDLDLLARLESEGFEVASHGYDHRDRLPFLAPLQRERRLRAIAQTFRPRLPLRGFRSASLGRTPEFLESLDRHFAWDSSVPDVDLEGEGGCATVFPFWIGAMLEIPITLPMESSLLYAGLRPGQIFERWSEKLEWVRRLGGVATAVLHAEPQLGGHRELRRLYEEWIATLPSDAWFTTPSVLLDHLAQPAAVAREGAS